MRPTFIATAAITALTLSACSSGSSPAADDEDTLSIVVTTTILGDIVTDIVGADGNVEVLMSPGQDPHGFAISAQQTQSVQQADLVVANGLDLEPELDDLLEGAEDAGVPVLRVADGLDPLPFADLSDEHADEHADEDDHADHADEHAVEEDHADHDHGDLDPHVWLDPVRMATGADLIAEALAEVAPDAADWAAAGERVATDILALHDEVTEILSIVPDECRLLVTNHDSLGYLAARYDFEVLGTVLPGGTSQAEPSAGDFAALVDTVRASAVPAIFAESTESGALAETLAQETGREIEVVTLYTGALGEPGSGAETYAELLVTDATRIADALATC